MGDDLVDLDVELSEGPAVVTIRITSWPTRPRWGYAGGDPGDPGEWDVIGCEVQRAPGSTYLEPPGELSAADLEAIERVACEWLADQEQAR